MRNCRSRLIIAPAILLALGCGSPTTTVLFEEPSIQAKEGTRFRYWVDYLIDGEKLEFYGESRLISTIAEIGGRDSLLAYEWAPDNRLEFWDASNGELWQYYSTTETTGDPQSGVWLQVPTAGMGKITTTVVDVTITDSHGNTHRFKRLIESEPVKRYTTDPRRR